MLRSAFETIEMFLSFYKSSNSAFLQPTNGDGAQVAYPSSFSALLTSINTDGSSIVAGKFTVLFLAKSASAFLIVLPLRVRGSAWTLAANRNDAIGLLKEKLETMNWIYTFSFVITR